jgi:hypothetical protein
MPLTEIDIIPYSNKPISQGVMDFYMKQLEFYKAKALRQPEFEPYLHELVKEIEEMRRDMDNEE